MKISRIAAVAAALALLAVVHACGNAPSVPAARGAATSEDADVAGDLDALRRQVAALADLDSARAAGYTERLTPCWYHRELGGQGVHYARPELIDDSVALLEPELVMYEPLADGSEQFLAVEYIVPFDAWTRPAPPELLGRTFMHNERLGLYVLHVWLGKDNPSGVYADWNPNVTCEHATESEDRA